MADQKISALNEAVTVAAADEMVLVQGGETHRVGVDTVFSTANATWQGWTMLTAPTTHTTWDGDSFSTFAKTVEDMSVKFAVPENSKAILVQVRARDSGSAAGDPYIILSPNNTAGQGPLIVGLKGFANDTIVEKCEVVPCNVNGNIYFQIEATGASTMDVWVYVWGYLQ